ncbi:MAG: hypothetical protein CMI90_04855 [Pelagibacteraceae bacterium]|mgnify:CR=1 FL=1|nr:hypothetical protein [Pelagibacteraceae bacterium]|tara:strand:- start:59 stop:556 length:498 start_codon:yes stop_codon:yes gene_type:complete
MNKKLNIKTCNYVSCENEGLYKAPISKLNLKIYQWLCLEHVKEFNKSWNYHKEMGFDEIEIELKKDTTWRRPTKPFGSGAKFNEFEFDGNFENISSKINKNSNKLLWSLDKLKLTIKASLDDIKKSYKKLAKQYHPDTKNDIENSEDKFKEIVEAYTYLSDYYKK